MVELLINIYKKYGHLFQGRLFSAVILFYKYGRTCKSKLSVIRRILKDWWKIKVFGGKKAASIEKLLSKTEFDSELCEHFIYTWDVNKSSKIHNKILGNCTIDYRKILDYSLTDYYMKDDSQFGKDNDQVLEAIISYLDRLALYVEQSDIENKENIVKYLKNMKNGKAETLEEALQRILFINQIQWQLGHILVGLGRLDLYLERFDCDEQEAETLFTEFFTLIHKYFTVKSNALMGDTGQGVILGGKNPDGTYFCGKYTKTIIRAVQSLKLPDPKVLLRVSSVMPQDMWSDVVDTMTSNVGSPLISNDDLVIPKMVEFGYEYEDACNYITSACWEPIAAESYEQNNILSLNCLKPFDYISANKDLSKIDSMETLTAMYKEGLKDEIDKVTKYLSSINWEKDPLYSMFSKEARERKLDVAEGGAKYNNYGILTVAMANAVNSFENINRLVFVEKKYTYKEFDELRKNNFKNCEELVTSLKDNWVYGKDESRVVDFVNELTVAISDIIKDYRNPLGGKLKFGLSSPHYIMNSGSYGASFDGRKAGDPFAVHISSSGNGGVYTELFNFASELDYSDSRFNGNVVDFMVTPSFVTKNKEKFGMLLTTAFKKGVYQMQANVIDSKILIEAKAHPENYPNLIVRVWGFNAFFNELPEEYKDYLIERALQSESAA